MCATKRSTSPSLPGRSLYGATTQRSGEDADDADDDAAAAASLDDDDDDDDRGGARPRDGSSNDARAEGEGVDVFSGTRRGAGPLEMLRCLLSRC